MNILFFYNLLIPLAFQGLLWTIALLGFCFGGVIVANLARLGWEYKSERANAPNAPESPDKPKEEKKAPTEKPQEPIYYIVEKKKRRPKGDFGEAKPFQFKES